MNYTTDQRRKLWGILASLAAAVAIAVILDCLPLTTPPTTDVLDHTVSDSSPEDTTPPDMPPSVTAEDAPSADPGDDIAASAPADSTPAETTPPTPVNPSDTSFILTFLGECAPGSPLGTDSFGSLNALTKEEGTGYFFSELKSILSTDDLTVAANNCIFTDADASAIPGCAAPSSSVNIYKDGSIGFLSLAAPSLSEYSDSALADTKASLDAQGIRYAEDGQITLFEDAGVRVALVCLQLEKNINTADDITVIRQAKDQAEYVIVYFWGGDNDSHAPEEWLTSSLRSFADAGASLIVGCGNGVLRPVEQYGTATIAYSLGTLLDGSSMYYQNATALLRLTLFYDANGTLQQEIELIPCYVYEDKWKPCRITDPTDENQVNGFLKGQTETPVKQ